MSDDPSILSAGAVLATILDGRHADAFAKASMIIDQQDAIIDRKHRLAWIACHALMSRGERIDAMTVANELSSIRYADAIDIIKPGIGKREINAEIKNAGVTYEDSALAAIGGMLPLTDMALAYGHAGSLEANARIVMAHHRCRVLLAILDEQRKALESPDGVKRCEEIAEATINATAALIGNGKHTTDLGAATAQAGMDHDVAQKAERSASARWGVTTLDHALPLDLSRLTILAAPRSCGKTSLALQAIEATAAEHGRGSVAVVSLEMPAVELATIIAARAIGVNAKLIRDGMLNQSQRQALADLAESQTSEGAIAINDAAFATNVDAICAWVRQRQSITRRSVRLVVIDHLQALSPTNPKANEYAKISEATSKLKALALEQNVCVMALSQLSRAGTRQDRKGGGLDQAPPEPQLADLRGSGTIEQDADSVVMLWPQTGIASSVVPVIAKVAKHRSGDVGNVELEWARTAGQLFKPSCARASRPDAEDPRRLAQAEANADWITR